MEKFYKKYAPNPRFERSDYEFLCGEWDFCFADENQDFPVFDKKINVPYSYECDASGIGDVTAHECIWYKRTINVKQHSGAILLHFEAIDYHSFVYVNGKLATEHIGGFTAFSVDITNLVNVGENEITIKVLDSFDKSQLRGKQRAKSESYECWYVQTTGIWKPVWMEYVGSTYFTEVSFVPNNNGTVKALLQLNAPANVTLCVCDGETQLYTYRSTQAQTQHVVDFVISNPKLWSCTTPNLYNVQVTTDTASCDVVNSYFGFCNVTTDQDGLYVNGNREFQQMILYQGFWKDTMLSAPNDEELEKDIDLIKAMGFNGVRVHQKVENEVFYYLCDKKGLYVWGEMPSAYEFTEKMQEEFSRDSMRIYNQLKNHVCVVSWLLFNETWGVYQIKHDKAQQDYINSIADILRNKDSRPIITNDGWYHLDSDILSLHEYEQDADVFQKEYCDKNYVVSTKTVNVNTYGKAFADGYKYSNQPVFISEFGGIALDRDEGWGYGESATSVLDYKNRLQKLVKTVVQLPYVSGCCYTQFNDTQQEVNGLLDACRQPKLPVEVLRGIFGIDNI